MEKKEPFGQTYAKRLDIGDLVEWSEWSIDHNQYEKSIGKLTELSVESISGRLVSMAHITDINKSKTYKVFTINLKVISKSLVD